MGIRRRGRILAFQTIFSWEVNKNTLDQQLQFDWAEEKDKNNEEVKYFASFIAKGTIENQEEIDNLIKDNLVHWDFDRLSRIDLALLRIGVFSLLYQKDIPASVVIDEAISIAKQFSANDSYKFVNGVLDSIRKKIEEK